MASFNGFALLFCIFFAVFRTCSVEKPVRIAKASTIVSSYKKTSQNQESENVSTDETSQLPSGSPGESTSSTIPEGPVFPSSSKSSQAADLTIISTPELELLASPTVAPATPHEDLGTISPSLAVIASSIISVKPEEEVVEEIENYIIQVGNARNPGGDSNQPKSKLDVVQGEASKIENSVKGRNDNRATVDKKSDINDSQTADDKQKSDTNNAGKAHDVEKGSGGQKVVISVESSPSVSDDQTVSEKAGIALDSEGGVINGEILEGNKSHTEKLEGKKIEDQEEKHEIHYHKKDKESIYLESNKEQSNTVITTLKEHGSRIANSQKTANDIQLQNSDLGDNVTFKEKEIKISSEHAVGETLQANIVKVENGQSTHDKTAESERTVDKEGSSAIHKNTEDVLKLKDDNGPKELQAKQESPKPDKTQVSHPDKAAGTAEEPKSSMTPEGRTQLEDKNTSEDKEHISKPEESIERKEHHEEVTHPAHKEGVKLEVETAPMTDHESVVGEPKGEIQEEKEKEVKVSTTGDVNVSEEFVAKKVSEPPGNTGEVTGDSKEDDSLSTELNQADDETKSSEEDMPSFDEFKRQLLKEEEQKTKQKQQDQLENTAPAKPRSRKAKQRKQNNYASIDCGAKIVQVNPEASNPFTILQENRDIYMLNPCSAKIWFIVELCDTVHVKKIEIANFELFSSTPESFRVYVSGRYPTREWTMLGTFQARDERDVQSFPLAEPIYAKYLKFEMLSHFGSEHYCPLSLLRVFGLSMVEELEEHEGDGQDDQESVDQDDETVQILPSDPAAKVGDQTGKPNILATVSDTLISMVKEAAKKLKGVIKDGEGNDTKDDPGSESEAKNSASSPPSSSEGSRSETKPSIVTLIPSDDDEKLTAPYENKTLNASDAVAGEGSNAEAKSGFCNHVNDERVKEPKATSTFTRCQLFVKMLGHSSLGCFMGRILYSKNMYQNFTALEEMARARNRAKVKAKTHSVPKLKDESQKDSEKKEEFEEENHESHKMKQGDKDVNRDQGDKNKNVIESNNTQTKGIDPASVIQPSEVEPVLAGTKSQDSSTPSLPSVSTLITKPTEATETRTLSPSSDTATQTDDVAGKGKTERSEDKVVEEEKKELPEEKKKSTNSELSTSALAVDGVCTKFLDDGIAPVIPVLSTTSQSECKAPTPAPDVDVLEIRLLDGSGKEGTAHPEITKIDTGKPGKDDEKKAEDIPVDEGNGKSNETKEVDEKVTNAQGELSLSESIVTSSSTDIAESSAEMSSSKVEPAHQDVTSQVGNPPTPPSPLEGPAQPASVPPIAAPPLHEELSVSKIKMEEEKPSEKSLEESTISINGNGMSKEGKDNTASKEENEQSPEKTPALEKSEESADGKQSQEAPGLDPAGSKKSQDFTQSSMKPQEELVSKENESRTVAEEIPTSPGPTKTAHSVPSGQPSSGAQKESVLMRLTNRIKALETNLTLSTMYMEKLNQKYRKSMEEMQKSFDKKVYLLRNATTKAEAAIKSQKEQISRLQARLSAMEEANENVNRKLDTLNKEVMERHIIGLFLEVILIIFVFALFRRWDRARYQQYAARESRGLSRDIAGQPRARSLPSVPRDVTGRIANGSLVRSYSVPEVVGSMTGSIDELTKNVGLPELKKKKRKRKGAPTLNHLTASTTNTSSSNHVSLVNRTAGLLFSPARGLINGISDRWKPQTRDDSSLTSGSHQVDARMLHKSKSLDTVPEDGMLNYTFLPPSAQKRNPIPTPPPPPPTPSNAWRKGDPSHVSHKRLPWQLSSEFQRKGRGYGGHNGYQFA
ncbi:SUN domain-containing ossification factor [Nematostella vectensis]|uniref:SUN domain-containing ossification factor n=1 Tax=Nematostella vectensis TaxID=45351 RepID=UPI0020777D2B|nr:SUN domain-containing ossification factor [Nematostella vectensis]